MKFDGVKCDECERVKGDGNHWITMQVYGDPKTIQLGGGMQLGSGGKPLAELHDLCGSACALKHISKLMGWNQ